MAFLRVHNLANSIVPPGRLYDHTAGNEVFRGEKGSIDYLLGQQYWIKKLGLDYFIAISWGEKGKKLLDIFGYSDVKDNWKTNVGAKSWVVENGVIIYDVNKEYTCGEGEILIGREQEQRIKTKNLQEYLAKPLDIDWINNILKFR